MEKKKGVVIFIIGILIPLAVGSLSAYITGDAMQAFGQLKKPPLAPPGWLFPVAWTVLYVLMGISSVLIYQSKSSLKPAALTIYFVQLVLNFIWSILFFSLGLRWLAFLELAVMWILILVLIIMCSKINKVAMFFLIPYLLWSTFAAYLNVGVALLNV